LEQAQEGWQPGCEALIRALAPAEQIRVTGHNKIVLSILDDFGLKPFQPPSPEDLYDILNERFEIGSILLTSNRASSE